MKTIISIIILMSITAIAERTTKITRISFDGSIEWKTTYSDDHTGERGEWTSMQFKPTMDSEWQECHPGCMLGSNYNGRSTAPIELFRQKQMFFRMHPVIEVEVPCFGLESAIWNSYKRENLNSFYYGTRLFDIEMEKLRFIVPFPNTLYSLEGAEYMTSLESFHGSKQLFLTGNLDFSALTKLRVLYIIDSQLESVVVSNNHALELFDMNDNVSLTNVVINSTGVETIKLKNCSMLKSIDLSTCVNLDTVNLSHCDLHGTLDLSNNSKLNYIFIYGNPNLEEVIVDWDSAERIRFEVADHVTITDCNP
jgi:hypothetical protein